MSSVSFNRKKAKLKQLLGIRARLALLALILVTPLMLERARSLEDTRSKQVALASAEFANLAKHSADAQQEVISSVETILKSAAYIRASAGGISRGCDLLRASVPVNLPWIRSLSIVGKDGRIQCSTLSIPAHPSPGQRRTHRPARPRPLLAGRLPHQFHQLQHGVPVPCGVDHADALVELLSQLRPAESGRGMQLGHVADGLDPLALRGKSPEPGDRLRGRGGEPYQGIGYLARS